MVATVMRQCQSACHPYNVTTERSRLPYRFAETTRLGVLTHLRQCERDIANTTHRQSWIEIRWIALVPIDRQRLVDERFRFDILFVNVVRRFC